jgi:hypothetical protein
VRHLLGQETKTVRKHVADDKWLRHGCWELPNRPAGQRLSNSR